MTEAILFDDQINLVEGYDRSELPPPKEAWPKSPEHIIKSDECPRTFHVNCLPVELLHKIFSYLSLQDLCKLVVVVCRQWRDLAYDPLHWQVLDLSSLDYLQPCELFALMDRSPLLKDLSVPKQSVLSNYEAHYIATRCSNLKSLNLGFTRGVDEVVLQQFVEHCTDLEKLNLEGTDFANDSAIVQIICGFNKLTTLNLSHCKVEDCGILQLNEKLPLLADIDIDGIMWITD